MIEALSISDTLQQSRKNARRSYHTHREERSAYKKRYRKENIVKLTIEGKIRYERRKTEGKCVKCGKTLDVEGVVSCSQCLAKGRAYYQRHREHLIHLASVRKSRSLGTSAVVRDGKCRCCGQSGFDFTVRHHFIMREAGGSDAPENLIELCRKHHRAYEKLTAKLMCEKLLALYGEEKLRSWIKLSLKNVIMR